ncbi:MAG: hypothetical protein HY020_06895 [Burkholderiales bacterium]|nr:hypothetical protein [Burkholderiales bacterium]
MKFPGFDAPIDRRVWRERVQIPERFFSVDGQRFVQVDLEKMTVPSDARKHSTIQLKNSLRALSDATRLSAAFMLIDALDGHRKTSTVEKWTSELGLFCRTISELLGDRKLNVITLGMYLWYEEIKGPSQVKMLRGALLYWISTGAPGLQAELVTHLQTSSPRPPRGMIAVQNDDPTERPFSTAQVHAILDAVAQLYRDHRFDSQSNFLWRLMISEAARPSQMSLMQFGDFTINRNSDGTVRSVRMMAAMVKQAGVPARSYMTEHRLSHAVAHAFMEHLDYVEKLAGKKPANTWPVFGVQLPNQQGGPAVYDKTGITIAHLILRSRKLIVEAIDDLDATDLFNRRLKHTKLTHLASAGASVDVLAHAGYQTSTISLQRYINLTEESFAEIEALLEDVHIEIASAFAGEVIERSEATFKDPEHRIVAPSLDDDLGACGAVPCSVLASYGCYGCHRFQAFRDGPHEMLEAKLVADQERARAAGLPAQTVQLNERTLANVRHVISIVRERS